MGEDIENLAASIADTADDLNEIWENETMTQDKAPGSGKLEMSDEGFGLVFERFADGSVSFDIFDAVHWPGTDEEGLAYANLIMDTAAERDKLKAENAELRELLLGLLSWPHDLKWGNKARAALSRTQGE